MTIISSSSGSASKGSSATASELAAGAGASSAETLDDAEALDEELRSDEPELEPVVPVAALLGATESWPSPAKRPAAR